MMMITTNKIDKRFFSGLRAIAIEQNDECENFQSIFYRYVKLDNKHDSSYSADNTQLKSCT